MAWEHSGQLFLQFRLLLFCMPTFGWKEWAPSKVARATCGCVGLATSVELLWMDVWDSPSYNQTPTHLFDSTRIWFWESHLHICATTLCGSQVQHEHPLHKWIVCQCSSAAFSSEFLCLLLTLLCIIYFIIGQLMHKRSLLISPDVKKCCSDLAWS